MSCASGSKGEITGAKMAVSTTISTASIPKRARRRRTSRDSTTCHSRYRTGRAGDRVTASVATDWGALTPAPPTPGGPPRGTVVVARSASSESNSRIEVGVQHVDEKVHDHERARQQEHGGL